MPIGAQKKGKDGKAKLVPVRVTTMDAELEFDIEVRVPELEDVDQFRSTYLPPCRPQGREILKHRPSISPYHHHGPMAMSVRPSRLVFAFSTRRFFAGFS